jgi:uncharacterized coiled-coil protein SlyX
MDSIERMRRINDLTKELKQHGFADSSFEAIKQANQIYGSDEMEDNVKNGMIQSSPHERITKAEAGDDSVSFSDRKLAKLSENVDTLTNKLNEIVRAINDLDARMGELKTRQDRQDKAIAMLNSRPVQESRSEQKVERSEPTPERAAKAESAPESHAAPVKDEYSMNQRTGSFQSQDVAIDKMFYYGNKK